MKSIEYYCGADFDARCGQELTASEWLYRKVSSANILLQQLVQVDYTIRDGLRIKRVSDALKDWRQQIDEIYGLEREIE